MHAWCHVTQSTYYYVLLAGPGALQNTQNCGVLVQQVSLDLETGDQNEIEIKELLECELFQ